MTATIGPANFPTPLLALRSANQSEEKRVRGFASMQAEAAEAMRERLSARWHTAGTSERTELLRAVHADLIQWRYELALRAPGRIGRGIPLDAERFRATIAGHGLNYDRIGYIGRLRAGATWDAATRTFRGGRDTPAHRTMLAYGDAAIDRFRRLGVRGDVLDNPVALPDGACVRGNRLVRGEAAQRLARDLFTRIAQRGADTSQIETGGEPVYLVSAENEARAVMFSAAISLLAGAARGDVAAWQNARYLLYQAPVTKKGSDAVTRTFLVAVGAVLLGTPPTLEHDTDLRCLVLGQDRAVAMPSDPVVHARMTWATPKRSEETHVRPSVH
ncbi:hypothetical protein GCM10010174_57740 [Kutzneria viridogrisea]|uniref:Uncharacterized protein n=1 Tax=Kutzneria viridogrisea TaxID=47990 RepID=A0ABR6BL52_9PSEU|nr:hypothetical protein [Kutzneria viridogrisea]